MVRVLFSTGAQEWADYDGPFQKALAEVGMNAEVLREAPPETVDYIVYAPSGEISDLSPYINAKAVLSTWAGVERIVTNPTLTQPLARMVDPGLAEGMAEWVTGHVLRVHLGLDLDVLNSARAWTPRIPPLARERTVGILGMGALGTACAGMLAGIGFRVVGWARRPQPQAPVPVRTGDDGLGAVLGASDHLVLLLPLTGETRDTLDAARIAAMKPGAHVLNPGRGPLIDDKALLAALDSGHLAHATLDVFREEPLPRDHPFWTHPKVTVTPHIAAATRAVTAARVLAENIRRGEAGEPFLHLVDRDAGY